MGPIFLKGNRRNYEIFVGKKTTKTTITQFRGDNLI